MAGDLATFRHSFQERLRQENLWRDGGRHRFEIRLLENIGPLMSNLLALAAETQTTIEGGNSTGHQLEAAYLNLVADDEFWGVDLIGQS
ncbi:MAG: hypothetical protein M2R45_03531 [Verrucomicrobia subdivision 3 bacterium]|nr:hypothetical protein [Limisphaerales bacterium]MCS1415928.1 hypothetical protein [Limisphaerales bacterium]